MKYPKRILVAPLCWGLGHAARCIPIIQRLIARGVSVVLGSDGVALALLRAEFPTLPFVELPAYKVRYESDNMVRSIAPQVPHLLRVLQQERQALESIIKSHKIDALISDNRYGLHHPAIPCVLLSHQLNIQMPYRWLEWLFGRLNHHYWRKFRYCWIPDKAEEPSLAGILSHGTIKGANVRYIGILSRMERRISGGGMRYDLLAVLSGPEPQRSRWEAEIIRQASQLPLRVGLVRGLPPEQRHERLGERKNIESFSFLTTTDLNEAMLSASVIVARSGYSTIMDLARLGCRQVLLVPTPGQTEQVYLARRFAQQKIYYTQSSDNFDLATALAQMPDYTGLAADADEGLLDTAIEELLQSIPS